MDDKYVETLSAFFDGEHVDPDLLAESLGQPGALPILEDFAAMRAQASQDPCHPSPEILACVAERLRRSTRHQWWIDRLRRGSLAAGVVFGVGLSGYLLGTLAPIPRGPLPQSRQSPMATATRVEAPIVIPQLPPTAEIKPAPVRPSPAVGGPPVPSLRLRLGQWRDTTPVIAEEAQRQ